MTYGGLTRGGNLGSSAFVFVLMDQTTTRYAAHTGTFRPQTHTGVMRLNCADELCLQLTFCIYLALACSVNK